MKSCDSQLRYFLKIAEAGSMSIASQRLEMTQSALSKQMSLLEGHLEQALFTSNGRGLTLTPAGAQLRAAATAGFEAIDQCLDELRSNALDAGGSLRIAMVHTLPFHFIPSLVSQFLGAFPKINVSIAARSSPDVVDMVESGRAEVGFVYDTAVASPRLASCPMYREQMCVVAHRDAPIGAGGIDLLADRIPLIVFPPSYALRRMLESSNVKHTVVTEVETIEMMLKLASTRLGYCILPDHLSADVLAEHQLVKHVIVSPPLTRQVVSVVRERPTPPRFVTRLLSMASSAWAPTLSQPSSVLPA